MIHHAAITAILSALLLGAGSISAAQKQAPKAAPVAPPAPVAAPPVAQSGDVDSIDHILAAVYDVISGPAGPRDWDRFRSLFFAGARLIPTWRDDKGNVKSRILSPDEYAQRAGESFSKEGFFEASIANRVESWEHLAHVWSTYESQHAKGEKPFARGVNSFQLFFDGARWWIVTIYWEGEAPGHALPAKYLKEIN
jgi:hypothetical protein